jgi:hypothetical protein
MSRQNDVKKVAVRLLDTFDQVLRLSRNWGAGLETTRLTDHTLVVHIDGKISVNVRVSVPTITKGE